MRTSVLAVQGILLDNWDGVTDLTGFIQSASVIVDRVVTCALARPLAITLTTPEQELIERWLAAHFYCRVDKTYQSKSTAGASASFTGQTGMSLDATEYGQCAVNLDFSGCLSAIGKRAVATGVWLGPPDTPTPYPNCPPFGY